MRKIINYDINFVSVYDSRGGNSLILSLNDQGFPLIKLKE